MSAHIAVIENAMKQFSPRTESQPASGFWTNILDPSGQITGNLVRIQEYGGTLYLKQEGSFVRAEESRDLLRLRELESDEAFRSVMDDLDQYHCFTRDGVVATSSNE